MTTTAAPLYTPPGFEIDELMSEVDARLLDYQESRRAVALSHPLHFALIYFRHLLSEGTGVLSLNDLHIQMADEAQEWRKNWKPGAYRQAWVAPRECGKSTWMFRILPMWASVAIPARRFVAMFANDLGKARMHMQNIRDEMRDNDLLAFDFPKLCTPGESSDTGQLYVSQGGRDAHIFYAGSMEGGNLGLNVHGKRPGLILCDDIEPEESKYGEGVKEKRLSVLSNVLSRLGNNAAITVTGTVTKRGSLVHDLVKHAKGEQTEDWVKQHKFRVGYFPAILTDPTTGQERSIWEQKWPVAELQADRHSDEFKLNMMNDPVVSRGAMWRPEELRDLPDGWRPGYGVLSVDPAKTSGRLSDQTGLAVVKEVLDENRNVVPGAAFVDKAWGVREKPEDLKLLIHEVCRADYDITHVILETNAAGDWFTLDDLPRRVQEVRHSAKREKRDRIHRLHQDYAKGNVYQRPKLGTLEDQQFTFPRGEHDDILDAVTAGVDHLLYGTAE